MCISTSSKLCDVRDICT